MMSDIIIKRDDGKTHFFVDGHDIVSSVLSYSIRQGGRNLPTLTVEMYGNIYVESTRDEIHIPTT